MVSSRPTVDFDGTYIRPSYDSGRVFSDHVPRQHGTPVNNGGPVATPGSDRNGGYQQMPLVYGAYPGYQPPVSYQQREPYGDPTYNMASYYSGRVFSDHVPRQHETPVNSGGPVATPGSDRNGGYQQMPPVYGAYPGYQPPVPYQQREAYGDPTYNAASYYSGRVFSDHVPRQHGTPVNNGGPVATPGSDRNGGYQQMPQGYRVVCRYRPPVFSRYRRHQSTHGQYTQDYRSGGVAPYYTSHAHGVNNHIQYAEGNGYVWSPFYTSHAHGVSNHIQYAEGNGYVPRYPHGAPPADYGSGSYQHNTPGGNQFDDDEPNGYDRRDNLTATTENTKVANKLSTCQIGHQEPQRNVILVAGRQDAGGDSVEFLFQMAENMARVVGVGFNWSKVVINRQYDVSIIHVGESAWSDLWNEVRTEATPHNESNSFSLMNIEFLTTPTEQVDTLYNLTAQESSKRFGVGLEGSGLGVHVYADDNNIQSGEDFPLIFSLVEHMGFKRENAKDLGKQHSGTSSSKATSSGNNTQTSPKEEKCLPQQNQGPTKKNHGDNEDEESHHPPEDSGLQQHSQSPIDPKDTSLIVIVIPESGGTFHRGSTNDIEYPRDSIKLAAIDPRLEFKFEKLGNYRKITTTTKTRCHLGGGEPKYRELDCGYYQDNITISLNCEKEDAARLSSSEVTAIVSTKQTTVETFTDSSSLARQTGGQIGGQVQIPVVGIGFQAQGNMNVTSTIGGSSSLAESEEISNTQLAGFFVNPADRKGSQVYNFLYRTDVLRLINNPAKFISAGICRTLSLTIVGEWDALDMDDACLYNFKTERDLMSVGDLMQSFAAWEVPYMRQRYQVPFYINHAMTHIGGYGTTVLIHGPGEQRLEHVLTKYPAIA